MLHLQLTVCTLHDQKSPSIDCMYTSEECTYDSEPLNASTYKATYTQQTSILQCPHTFRCECTGNHNSAGGIAQVCLACARMPMNACMQAYPPIVPGHDGWPLNTDNMGTGCVKAPDLPKGQSICFYARSEYSLTSGERAAFCTESGLTNAVAQLRHAVENGRCPFLC